MHPTALANGFYITKLAKVDFKEIFEALANCSKNNNIDNTRRGWDIVGTVFSK